jgi:hypothetical protein
MSQTYKMKVKCPKCQEKTHTFASHEFGDSPHYWIEFCPKCGWYFFIARPYGEFKFRLQVYGIDATEEDLAIINKVLKTNLDINIPLIQKEGNWKELP